MASESDSKTPSRWLRALGTTGAAYVCAYGAVGLLRNDLHVSLSKSDHVGVHLHGALACLCFAGMLAMSIGLMRFLAPQLSDDEFDFSGRRQRFGPLVVLGLVLFIVSQAVAGLGS